ncbi:MAG: hypothetical protein ACR2LX_01990 [Jatrophihabitans sp.]
MSERVTRETAAGRAYLDLRRLAKADRRPTDEYLRLYALEGFLARLAASPHRDRSSSRAARCWPPTTRADRRLTSIWPAW